MMSYSGRYAEHPMIEDRIATKGSIMLTAKGRTSRITTWLVFATLIAWIALFAGCGAKKGGDTSLLPGKQAQDAGGSSMQDAKSDARVTPLTPADAGSAQPVFDARPPPTDAAPKPMLVSISVSPSE